MKKIGLTGASEFLGKAICRELRLHGEYEVIALSGDLTGDEAEALAGCDWIIHAAVTAKEPLAGQVYDKNVQTGQQLCSLLSKAAVVPPILYVSSIREGDSSEYGQARAAVRKLLEAFAREHQSTVTTFLVPNEFGPCGRPYYNSVVTTFCCQLQNGEKPVILQDSMLDLVYTGSVAQKLAGFLAQKPAAGSSIEIKADRKMKVSELLKKLEEFQKYYCEAGIIPALNDPFEIALFNTFRSYLDPAKFFPHPLVMHRDERGDFVELVKQQGGIGQFSYSSTTEHGVARGEHFHTRKIERFMVIRGRAKMAIRAIDSDQKYEFELDGDHSTFVDVPVWYTHNLTNVGDGELLTAFWINEIYNPADPDTFREKV